MKLSELAAAIGAKVKGSPDIEIKGLNSLSGAGPDDISFVLGKKYLKEAAESKAAAVIADFDTEIPGKAVVLASNAKAAYAMALSILYPEKKYHPFISAKSSIDSTSILGKDVHIADFVVIGPRCKIGDNCVILAGTVIDEECIIGDGTVIEPNCIVYRRTEIGKNCIIHGGAAIGGDGFAFVEHEGRIIKVPQKGNVKIGNDAEIGNNVTIDRAAFGTTEIGNSVKIDNLVQIAHNVKVGDGTMIAAQTGIAGSSITGKYCILGGQVGVADHVVIGNMVKIGSQSGVSKDVEDNAVMSGTPARPLLETRKSEARVARLAEMFDRIKTLEEEIKKLKEGK